jgi:hypothetical protein
MTSYVLAALIAVLATHPGSSPGSEPGPSWHLAQGSAQSPRPQIADLAWLEGHWVGTDGPMQMEEIWTSAAGDALVGLHKDVATRAGAARMVSFEFLRIEAGADGVAYVAQPGGRPPTRFTLVESGPRRVVFANPAHDFPQRILYRLDDAGALHARIEGPKGGKTVGQEWTWTRRPAK